MIALVASLLFTAAFTVSAWAMLVTIQPRLPYMRALLKGQAVPDLAPAAAPRVRSVTRPVAAMPQARSLRAVA